MGLHICHYRIILLLLFIVYWIVLKMVLNCLYYIKYLLNYYIFCFIFSGISGILINFWVYFIDLLYYYYGKLLCDNFKFDGKVSVVWTYLQHI